MSTKEEFNELLDRAYRQLSTDNDIKKDSQSKIAVILPKISMTKSKTTLWENFVRVCKSINRDPNFVKKYIETECIVKCSICGVDSNQLLLKGRYNQKQIETVLIKFVREYVSCDSCRSLNTEINKQARLLLLNCKDCQSIRNIVK